MCKNADSSKNAWQITKLKYWNNLNADIPVFSRFYIVFSNRAGCTALSANLVQLQGLKKVHTGVLDLNGSDATPDTKVAAQNG